MNRTNLERHLKILNELGALTLNYSLSRPERVSKLQLEEQIFEQEVYQTMKNTYSMLKSLNKSDLKTKKMADNAMSNLRSYLKQQCRFTCSYECTDELVCENCRRIQKHARQLLFKVVSITTPDIGKLVKESKKNKNKKEKFA
jgi:uncharacterized protein YutD